MPVYSCSSGRHIGKSYLSKIRQTSSLELSLWMILAVKRSAHCEQSLIIVGVAEIDVLPIFGVNNSNSQLRWGFNIYSFIRSNLRTSGRSLLWFTTKRSTFQKLSSKRSLQNSEAFYHRVQTKTSELTENSTYWPITKNTHFVQLSIAYRNKSATSNKTFICFESSLRFFSTRWIVVSRVFLMLSRSESLALGGRWNSTWGIKI